jgi:hypothetical protein
MTLYIDAESLARKLAGVLSGSDAIVRTCINGFIIVGLLGTLFNLWRFGPSFWTALLEGSNLIGRPAIGVAFAASIFGLGWALVFSLFDVVVIRRRRETFVRQAAEWLTSKAVEQLPPTQEAAVAQALDNFSKTSKSILDDLKSQHATLTQSLVDQIKDSSETLDTRLKTVADNWENFLAGAISKIKEEGERLEKAARQLTDATVDASKTLRETTATLESYKNLSELIAEVRTESGKLISEVTRRLQEFSEQMQETLSGVARVYAEALQQESEAANKRLTDLMDGWHTRSAATLWSFAATIQKASDDFSANWQQFTKSLQDQVNQLIRGWQVSLSQGVDDVRGSLTAVNEQLKETGAASAEVLQSSQAAFQNLLELQKAITAFSHRAPDDNRVGDALVAINETLRSLEISLNTAGSTSGRPPAYSDRELLNRLDALPNQIAQAVARATQISPHSPIEGRGGPTSVGKRKPFFSRLRRWFR